MARTLLLDLDGTLVDTVPDLAAALNRLMASRGLAPFSLAETAAMVGDGVAVLVGAGLRRPRPDARRPARSPISAAITAPMSPMPAGRSPASRSCCATSPRRGLAAGRLHQQAGSRGAARCSEPWACCRMLSRDRRRRQFSGAQARPGASAGDAAAGGRRAGARGDGRRSRQRRRGGAWRRGEVGLRHLGLWAARDGRRGGRDRARSGRTGGVR